MSTVVESSSQGTPIPAQIRLLPSELNYIQYAHSLEKTYLPSIRALIARDLSEPYSIYVYRYFLYQWGDLCFMVGLRPLMLFTFAIHCDCNF